VGSFERDLLIERTHAGLMRVKALGEVLDRAARLTREEKRAVREKRLSGG
jgi:putative DNA-invertase from lambdoid prophage Rac